MKTYSNRKAVPVKQDGKMKWIYVSPETYDLIIKKFAAYPNEKCKWIESEMLPL